jgi:hypothetical protein
VKIGLYIIISILFLNCNGISKTEKQDFGKVKICNEIIDIYSKYENVFICKDSMEAFDNGYAKIELKEEEMKILNFTNDGFESQQIEIKIDKNLKIESVNYSYSDDVEDGSKKEYEVIDAKININNNPFTLNTKQITAYYLLTIRETYIPSDFWKLRKYNEFKYKGKIECK